MATDSTEVIDDENAIFDASVFPNPTRSDNLNLHLTIPSEGTVRVTITDQVGKIQFEDFLKDISGSGDAHVHLTKVLSEGIYFITVSNGQESVQRKLLIKN
jgi:hypothetical protein